MILDDPLFQGLNFFDGVENLPGDIPINLNSIREWAAGSNLIFNPNQLMNEKRIVDISRLCSPEDKLLIGIAISGESGSLLYLEYPYLPVHSLIRRGDAVDLVFWKVTSFDVKFVFWITGCDEKFCTESTAARIVPKFTEMLDKLANVYPVITHADGSKEITVEGGVRANFLKDGRSFDVELTYKNIA